MRTEPAVSEFVDSLCEVFGAFGPIRSRRMFGGYGIYHDGLMFGLVVDDVLYLKADDASSGLFRERGLGCFRYEKAGKRVEMSYYMAPEEIFDEPELARQWALRAFEAALRNKKSGRRTKKGP
jgi:DNA transformation protein